MSAPKILRCAIYTRVSDDGGLDQDFNSLDAQREASEAFIKSQAHEGWRLNPDTYSDGGFSGGTLERPALQQLVADIRAGKVDIIIIYKVDRLTRSLADFAKLVEILDQHNASFVSVTQAFNTTNSMGRLTLNVLLSFAQFEREVTAERIRDKIAASKKKGIWMGGTPPLGYRVENRKLLVDIAEAETIRMIFRRYLELGSMSPLMTELHRRGVKTRPRVLSSGKAVGGIPFTKGPLSHLLKNRTYLGELNHHDKSYPGEHAAIVDPETFDKVQALLAANQQAASAERKAVHSLLVGKIFDERGNIMTPTYSMKGKTRYNYYVCRLLIEGRKAEAGPVHRIPAGEADACVVAALNNFHAAAKTGAQIPTVIDRAAIERLVLKVIVHRYKVVVILSDEAAAQHGAPEIAVPWRKVGGRPKREILMPHADATKDNRPVRAEVRSQVLGAVASGRLWLSELVSGRVSDMEVLASREQRSKRSVQMLVSLAFLAPDVVQALIEGKLPRGVGITRLVNLPPSWEEQRLALGLDHAATAYAARDALS